MPRLGMEFEDCRKRTRRLSNSIKKKEKGDNRLRERLIDSLKNQADLHQEGAWEALEQEVDRDFNNHSNPRIGWSPKYSKRYSEVFDK